MSWYDLKCFSILQNMPLEGNLKVISDAIIINWLILLTNIVSHYDMTAKSCWFLLMHDDAWMKTVFRLLHFDVLRPSPYSPDRATNNLHLPHSLQHFLAETCFIDEVKPVWVIVLNQHLWFLVIPFYINSNRVGKTVLNYLSHFHKIYVFIQLLLLRLERQRSTRGWPLRAPAPFQGRW